MGSQLLAEGKHNRYRGLRPNVGGALGGRLEAVRTGTTHLSTISTEFQHRKNRSFAADKK